MSALYRALDVFEGFNRVEGKAYFVRDEEAAHLWCRVEYVGQPGRLTCYCDDGDAHAESPDTEPPCVHLKSVIDLRAATQQSARAHPPVAVSALVD